MHLLRTVFYVLMGIWGPAFVGGSLLPDGWLEDPTLWYVLPVMMTMAVWIAVFGFLTLQELIEG